nr:hypothetical protein CFP56_57284 [Quercus suber]
MIDEEGEGKVDPHDSSIRNFDNGRAGYVANSVEQALLLPWDMAELQNLKKHEMFLSLKRDLALATQAAHMAEDWVDQTLYERKEEESKHYAAPKAQAQTYKKLKEILLKLFECDKAKGFN